MLSVIGGTKGQNESKRVFTKVFKLLFDNELIQSFSWTGKQANKTIERKKKPFMIYVNTIDLIFEVVNKGCRNYSKIENETEIKKLLKYATVNVCHKKQGENSQAQAAVKLESIIIDDDDDDDE